MGVVLFEEPFGEVDNQCVGVAMTSSSPCWNCDLVGSFAKEREEQGRKRRRRKRKPPGALQGR